MTIIDAHPNLRLKAHDGRSRADVLAELNGGYYVTREHLLRGPRSVYKPIPESTTQPYINPRSAILHTNAGTNSAFSLWGWISRASVVGESHFQVSYRGIEQYMPLNRRADCNYSANSFQVAGKTYGAISFETQDNGSATLTKTPWSLLQVELLVASLTAICATYNVHCVQPATWDASGIGHHSLFPFQGIGSKAWTNVRGKTCPGAARIAQMDHIRAQVQHRLAAYVRATGWSCPGTA